MNWSVLPYYDCYNINSPLLINGSRKQTLYMGNDTIPKVFLNRGFNFFTTIKSCVDLYEKNTTLERVILDQINQTQNSVDYYGGSNDYQCCVFSYQSSHLIAVYTDEFCLNLVYNEDQKYMIMGQSDGFSLDIQTPDFRYVYNSEFDDDSSLKETEKTPKSILTDLYESYCELMMGPCDPVSQTHKQSFAG